MNTTAIVKIWGETVVGAVTWLDKGYAAFEYDPHWVKRGIELAPIKMPLGDGVFTFPSHRIVNWNPIELKGFSGLPGLLADSLPDKFGQRVLHLENTVNGLNLSDPVAALLYTGKRGPGALEYFPEHPLVASQPTSIENLTEAVEQILQATQTLPMEVDLDAIKKALRIGSSAGGARAKVLVAINHKTGDMRRPEDLLNLTVDYEHWLIKIDGLADKFMGYQDGYCQLEYAWYQMAKDAGIDISESRLLHDGDKRHFMTRRFDRVGPFRKLHYQSLHAMAHYNFNDLYQYGYEDLFSVMRQLNMPATDFEQQFRRMVFNLVACVADDHTKNFGFLLHPLKNVWALSPAFDLTFTYGLHAMGLNGKRRDFTLIDLEALAQNFHIKNWENIVNEVSQVVSNVRGYLKDVPMGTADFVAKEVEKARLI